MLRKSTEKIIHVKSWIAVCNSCWIYNRLISTELTTVGFIQFRYCVYFLWHRMAAQNMALPFFIQFVRFDIWFGVRRVCAFFSKCTGFLWVFHVYKVTQFRAIDVLHCILLTMLSMWVPVVLFHFICSFSTENALKIQRREKTKSLSMPVE